MDGSPLAAYHAAQKKGPTAELAAFGRIRRNPVGGPTVLNDKMHTMIRLMVHGREDDPARTPLSIFEAAAAVGYRRKAGRRLADSRLFIEAYHAACAAPGDAEDTA